MTIYKDLFVFKQRLYKIRIDKMLKTARIGFKKELIDRIIVI